MLTQENLLQKLSEWDVPTTSQTLRNREKQGLTWPAYRGGAGRPGRSVFYPERVLWENYAASRMLNSKMRLTAKEVSEARALAMEIEKNPLAAVLPYIEKPEHEQLELRFAEIWHSLIVYAWMDCPGPIFATVCFVDNGTRHIYNFVNKRDDISAQVARVVVNPQTQGFSVEWGQRIDESWLKQENIIDYDAIL